MTDEQMAELRKKAVLAVKAGGGNSHYDRYRMATPPKAILALLDENEQLRKALDAEWQRAEAAERELAKWQDPKLLGLMKMMLADGLGWKDMAFDMQHERDAAYREAQAAESALAEERAAKERLTAVLGLVAKRGPEAVALLRKHGYVFERAPSTAIKDLPSLSDGERWEHLAFALYSDLAELSHTADAALAEEASYDA